MFLERWDMPALDLDTGQTPKYCELCRHPKYPRTWNQYECNELGCLCQDIGTNPSGTVPCIKGIYTFFVISYEDIPTDWTKGVTYTNFLCKLPIWSWNNSLHIQGCPP